MSLDKLKFEICLHRRTSQGVGGLQLPWVRQKVFIKRQKRNSFRPAIWIARNSGFLLTIGWGESGKAILQVSISLFSGTVEIFFGQRWLSSPRKNWPVPLYAWHCS